MTTTKLMTAIAAVIATAIPTSAATASDNTNGGVTATFEGATLQLADSWGEATACFTDGTDTRCYRTEGQLIAAEGQPAAATSSKVSAGGQLAARGTCASSTRLYSGTSYTGSTLYLSGSAMLYNLSTYGWSNVTSSYRIGACSVGFYDGTIGVPPQYPGSTWAWASAASMLSGWDNRVSSVYIN